ncbi:hypothetical protein Tco_0725274, partial [Tanacetum coccineum]
GVLHVTSFKNALGANYLAHFRNYEAIPPIETVKEWFPTIGYSGTIEGTLKKASFLLAELVAFQAPNSSTYIKKRASQGKKPGATIGRRRKQSTILASTIIHYEFASGRDVSIASTAEDDPGKSNPNDSISKQQVIDKGTKIFSFDHIITSTNPHVLVDKTKSASEGLETVYTKA